MTIRAAIINTKTGQIETVVEYEDAPSNPPPGFSDEYIAVMHDRVGPDWTWDGKGLIEPPAEEPMPSVRPLTPTEKLEAAGLSVADLKALLGLK